MWYTLLITLVVDVGALLLIYVLLRDRVRRATTAAAQIAELRDEVSRLVVELNQTTERNVALLEDRINGLTDLLAAADRKIGLLRREIEKHDVGSQVYSRLAEAGARGKGASASLEGSPALENRHAAEAAEARPSLSVELSGSLEAGSGPGRTRRAEPQKRETLRPASGPRGETLAEMPIEGSGIGSDTVHQRVMMLSNSGFSAGLIATRVGIPLGEVELIIALERQRRSQASVEPGDAQS